MPAANDCETPEKAVPARHWPKRRDDKMPSSYSLTREVHDLLIRLKRERGLNFSQSIEAGVRMFANNVLEPLE